MMPRNERIDSGFTLVELLVAMSIGAVIMAMSVWGVRSWQIADQQSGTTSIVVGVLRATQERAMSEGVSYCVSIPGNDTYKIYRFSCTVSPVLVDTRKVEGRLSHLAGASFIQPDDSSAPNVTFRPSGSATPGSFTVTRDNSSKVYTVSVERLTGRVSQN